MKSFTKVFAKLFFIISVLFYSNIIFAAIESTNLGGNWNDEFTWINGGVPGPTDDVIINGMVFVENGNACKNLTIVASGILVNRDGGNRTLNVFGYVLNFGSILNNNYSLDLNVYIDITNHGTWQNRTTNLVGPLDQNIDLITDFDGQNLFSNKPSGFVHCSSTLRFNNTIIDFNGDSLYMDTGLDSVFVNDGSMREITLITNAAPGEIYCHLSNTAYVDDVNIEANDVILDGIFEFVPAFNILGNVRVEGILQNRNGGHRSATITGNVTNNGIIQDNNYNCYLYITGDISQNGTWTNNHTYLSGDADQNLWFTQTFTGENLTNSNSIGKVISNSTLSFNSTIIDFNSDTLMFASAADSLILTGDFFREGVITVAGSKTSGFLNCTLLGNAYFNNMIIVGDNINLGGVFQFQDPMNFYGNVTVEDTLQNLNGGNRTATIYGNLTNNGTIQDNNYNCYLNITGNINQNGIWTNNHTYLTGNGSQDLAFTQTFSGENFTSSKLTGITTVSTQLWFNNTIINFNNDSLYMNVGNDTLEIDGGYLKKMTILSGNAPNNIYFHQSNGSYFDDVNIEANEVVLDGIFEFLSFFNIIGNARVEGTFQNRNQGNQTATINGNMTNNGIIKNNNYINYLYITGDINQNGTWTNSYTYLSGDANQNLAFTQEFNGANFISNKLTGVATASTQLWFNGTSINFNSDSLYMNTGNDSIFIIGESLREMTILAGNAPMNIYFQQSNQAYVDEVNIEANEVVLDGVFEFMSTFNIFGDARVEGTLQTRNAGNQTVTINGSMTNNGTIKNNNYISYLYITGDIDQNSTWSNSYTYLSGDADQNLAFIQAFDGANFISNKPTGIATASTTLEFNNTSIDFNSDTLMFLAAADSLIINGGYFREAVITKESSKTIGFLNCTQSANAYFYNMDIIANNIDLGGNFQFQAPMDFYGHVTVSDTLQNRNAGSQTATINGNITNNGLIRDNNYVCNLNITGNVVQNGVWTNATVNMTGTIDQHIECLFGNPISATNFINTDPSARIISDGDLLFSASKFNLNGGELVMQAANKLSALGTSGYNSWIKDGTVTGQDFELEGNANAYLYNLTFEPNVILSGEIHLYLNIIFEGYIINSGILQNRTGASLTLNVGGRITNNGEIRNSNTNLTINCQGDVVNNGIWTNFKTILNGMNDQFVFLIDHQPISGQFRFDALALGAPYQWYYNAAILDSPDFNNEIQQTLIWNVPVQQAYYGDYYCQTGGGNSRTITVGGGLLADIAILLEGPFNSNEMSTSLNSSGYLPTSQPFSGSPWNYPGTENVASIPNADITDWVLVEYRVTPGGPENATGATMVARQAAFLLKDGRIVGLDGTNELQIDISITDNLYIAIWHRNHLGIMTSANVTQNGAAYNWDFRDDLNKAYQAGQGFKDIGSGYFGMVSGDGDGNGVVQSTDETNIWKPQLNLTGYLNGDFDMNGIAQSTDETNYWKPNLNTGGQIPAKTSTSPYSCQIPQ
jgi:hypothetical protein